MADFDDLTLGQVGYQLFGPESSILAIFIAPFSPKSIFDVKPEKCLLSRIVHFTFWWKYRICEFKIVISKCFLKVPSSAIQPINMRFIKQKLIKCEKQTK